MSADDGPAVLDTRAVDAKTRDKDLPEAPVTAPKRKASSISPESELPANPKRIKVEDAEEDKDASREETAQAAPVSDEGKGYRPSHPPGRRPDQADGTQSTTEDVVGPGAEAVTGTRRPSLSATTTNRRVGFSQEEKKRGKRLFGGLINTLSQTTGSSQQKRRLEIERRQQDKAQQQRVEDDKRRAERLAKVERLRRIEQVKFDEQAMQTRHSHILTQANNLKTKTEPVLYYRPWQLTDVQKETVKDQTRAAEELVDQERQEFRRRKEARLKELGITLTPSRPGTAISAQSNHGPADTTNAPATSVEKADVHERDRDHDETGDVMVEAEEDTVIY